MIKIILADDHQMFVEGLEALLKVKEEFSVIAKAQNGQELLHLLQNHSPDVLLLDINMPKLDGVEVMKHIKDSKKMIKVIILSTYNDFSLTKNLLQMGIMGYFPKTVSFDELITAIEKVHLGEVVIHKDILQKLQLHQPTDQRHQLLICQGVEQHIVELLPHPFAFGAAAGLAARGDGDGRRVRLPGDVIQAMHA